MQLSNKALKWISGNTEAIETLAGNANETCITCGRPAVQADGKSHE